MGGGSGGAPFSSGNLRRLENVARDSLQQGATPSKRNIFISFSSEDLTEVHLFRGQAKNENSDLEFSDRSLQQPFNSESEEYIKRGIRERIRQASVTVVYLSQNTAGSNWVDWEIRESIKLGKGVIAVHKGDSPPSNIPSAIREHNIEIVQWKQSKITEAINRAAERRTPSSD